VTAKLQPLIRLYCHRCGHRWFQRDRNREPRICPQCKNPKWKVPIPPDPLDRSRLSPLDRRLIEKVFAFRDAVPARIFEAVVRLMETETRQWRKKS